MTPHHQHVESHSAQCDVKEGGFSFLINVSDYTGSEWQIQAAEPPVFLRNVLPDGTPLDSIASLALFDYPQRRTMVRPAPGHDAVYLSAKAHY